MDAVGPPRSRGRFRATDRLIVFDVVAAGALVLVGVTAILDPPGPAFVGPTWVAWLVATAVALPMAVRRLWPRAVFGVVLMAAVVTTLVGIVGAGVIWVTYAPTVLALYLVALSVGRVWSGVALSVCLLSAAAAIAFFYSTVLPTLPPASGNSEVPLFWQVETGIVWVAMSAAWALGLVVGWRRAVTARFAHQLAREAVADERLRIARELHDVVGHSMSLIAVKATVANHIADARPDDVRSALGVIETTSRAALTDIRRVLGVLRSDTDRHSDLAPVPGPAELRELAERAESAGVGVDLQVRGTDELPAAVGLSVYRIVQEALTNVITHAAPAQCQVTVEADDRTVRIDVVDNGPGHRAQPERPGAGHGLVGMRERVALYGGTFSARSRPEGGFRVSAHLPYEPPEEGP